MTNLHFASLIIPIVRLAALKPAGDIIFLIGDKIH